MANVLATFAQFERRLIGQRTADALAMKRAAGTRLGRPPVVAEGVAEHARQLKAQGVSLRGIAAKFNEAGIPTGQSGKRWYASSVRALLARGPAERAT
jgi:DNA invertase Pin-like site-specific DNA recombinase